MFKHFFKDIVNGRMASSRPLLNCRGRCTKLKCGISPFATQYESVFLFFTKSEKIFKIFSLFENFLTQTENIFMKLESIEGKSIKTPKTFNFQ